MESLHIGRTLAVSRRTLVVGAAWAAPVILGAIAAPAVAASSTPTTPLIPVSELVVQAYSMWDQNEGGQPGPLGWAGGQGGGWQSPSKLPIGRVTYVVTLAKPNGTSTTLLTGSTVMSVGAGFVIGGLTWGIAPIPLGTYTLTVTVSGAGGLTRSDSTSVTVKSR